MRKFCMIVEHIKTKWDKFTFYFPSQNDTTECYKLTENNTMTPDSSCYFLFKPRPQTQYKSDIRRNLTY